MKAKRTITITLDPENQEKAKELSKKILGRKNISGLFAYWINKFWNEHE